MKTRQAYYLVLLPLFALGVLLAAGRTPARAEVIVDTVFAENLEPLNRVSAPGKSIQGVLPKGWKDDSAFNKEVEVAYTVEEEAGVKFLRIRRGDKGHAQIRFDPGLTQPDLCLYRVSIRARTPDSRNFHAIIIVPKQKAPWRTDVNLYAEWNTFVYEFIAPAVGEQAKPYFQFQLPGGGAGTVEIQSIRIERFSRDEIVADLKAAFPDGGKPGNRATSSRFPLGAPPAWVLAYNLDDAEAEFAADPAETSGPSGLPALKFAPNEKAAFYSAPLPVQWTFSNHVLSLYVKAKAPGELLVLKGGDPRNRANILGRAGFSASDQWQRVVLPFLPQLRGPVHLFALETAGPVWLDALQLEVGEAPSAWAPSAEAEVALAIPRSDASAAGIQFLDEPAALNLAVCGPLPAGCRLAISATDLYGNTRKAPLRGLQAGTKLETLALDFGGLVDPSRSAGLFRVEASVVDAAGKVISPIAETVVARLPRPRYWGKDAPESPFGVHVGHLNRSLVLAKATGHNWVRLHDTGNTITSWYHVEPKAGQWVWRDELLKKYRDQNLLVLGMLSTSPGWANGSPGTAFWDHAYLQPKPEHLPDWENYVRTITTRYAGQVAAWEVWNEPWLPNFWRRWDPAQLKQFPRGVRDPLPTVAAAYADLTQRAVRVAGETVPGKPVFGFNATGDHEGVAWVKALVDAHGLKAPAPSGFSYHSYVSSPSGYPDDAVFRNGLPLVSGPVRAARADGTLGMLVWMTEGGSNRDSTRDGLWKHTLPYENKDDWRMASREEVRYRLSTLAAGGEKYFAYAMHGFDLFDGSQTVAGFREARGNGGAVHPTAVADAAMQWLLEDLKFDRQVSLAEGVYAWVFAGKGRTVAVVTTAPSFSAWKLAKVPRGWVARDLWGNRISGPCEASADLLYFETTATPASVAEVLQGRVPADARQGPRPR